MARKKKDSKEIVIVRFKCTKELRKLLMARSLQFFDGNMSETLRYLIENFYIKGKKKG